MTMADIVAIVAAFLGWVRSILNALGITQFDEKISEAIENLG